MKTDPFDLGAPLNVSNTIWHRLANDWLFNFNSENTRLSYRRAIQAFFRFCPKHPKDVAKSDILTYRQELEDQGYSQATINLRITALSSLYNDAVTQNLVKKNPCETVKRKPVNPYGKATYLQGDQDNMLLDQVDRNTVKGKRDYVVLLIFLTTAVRVDALSRLRLSDLRIQGDQVFMKYKNKGGEEIERKLQPIVVKALTVYLETRQILKEDSPVFVAIGKHGMRYNSEGKAVISEKQLSVRSIQRMVKNYADSAFGEGHGITPHSLRHTAAMNAIYGGASVIEISRLLRHKNIRVTTVYIQHVEDKADDGVSQQLAKRYIQRSST